MKTIPSISRWIAAAGLITLLLPLFLSVFHQLQQQSVKYKMNAELRGTELTTVLLQPEELRWLKPGKEIWLNESFFDVLSIDSSSLPWKILGLYDPEDTKLHMKLIRLLHKEKNQEDHSLQAISGFWFICFLLPSQWTPDLPGIIETTAQYSLIRIRIPNCMIPTDCPPPRPVLNQM
ncbi:RasGAP domain-containing protein [Flavihumibacter cheonanensis]|uniref:hypothetical protein n=1 Tax=Flavihumibacter cheonanensis TaxID=1442385 RepID=UPI001EF85189|nr:hypothetical protein [Flavihumibacter cheonanensis]MCG7753773.1 hypothetical protein [Flavihumibacter cheonanensis]